ncbi:MAG: hypothetical protein AAFO59_03700 [Cyanobacteria bacterium J06607_17]
MTLAELNRQAFKTLMENLGYVNAVRFFKQFETGTGDYTQERHQWLDDVRLDDLWGEIQQRQSETS